MIRPVPADVLLVGPRAEDAAAVAARGLEHVVARSCLEAIATLGRRPCRVVVLSADETSGRERTAIAALKEAGAGPEVLLTAPPNGRPGRPMAAAAGADDFLLEPYPPEELLVRIDRLVTRSRDRDSGGRPAGPPPILGADVLSEYLADLGELGARTSALRAFLDALIRVFARRSGAHRVSLLLYDRKRDALVIRRAIGLPESLSAGTRIRIGQGIAGRAAKEGRPILVHDVRDEPYRALANRGPYRGFSCIALPLHAGGSLIGVLNLADRADGRPFDAEDLAVLSGFAPLVAQALHCAVRMRRLKALSIVDDLTGLYNRRYFRRTLERETERADRHQRPLTLAILDVDHFKRFNDLNGHEAGNRALALIGKVLKSAFRTSDVVCRYGGEEFAVIMPETEKGDTFVPETKGGTFGAYRFLERLRARIEEISFERESELPGGKLTISGGVASYPTDAATPSALLEAADRSLYLAKAEGRNRVR